MSERTRPETHSTQDANAPESPHIAHPGPTLVLILMVIATLVAGSFGLRHEALSHYVPVRVQAP